jgi:hypothetical protein
VTAMRRVLAYGALAALVSASAHAGVLNGGFEAGLAGWSVIGTVQVTAVPGVTVPEGDLEVVVLSSGESDLGMIDAILNAPNGTLATFPGHVPAQASALAQTVSVDAGRTLSFRWRFLTNEPTFGFEDFAFVSIDGILTVLADVHSASAALPPSSGFAKATPPALHELLFPVARTFVLGFGAVDDGAPGIDSALLVDDIRIAGAQAISEPTTAMLLVIALVSVGALPRRLRIAWAMHRPPKPTA